MVISELLKSRHVHCDDLFVSLEQLCADQHWDEAAPLFGTFCATLESHLGEEENIVFPAFESATGMTQGPTQVMRAEHAQMRALVAQMGGGLHSRNAEIVSGTAETLLILMQQHNLKEENILYPMFDRILPEGEIVSALKQLEVNACLT